MINYCFSLTEIKLLKYILQITVCPCIASHCKTLLLICIKSNFTEQSYRQKPLLLVSPNHKLSLKTSDFWLLHISVSMDTYGYIYWEATRHSLVCLYKQQQDRKEKLNWKKAGQPGWSILDPIRTPRAASHMDVTLTLTWVEWLCLFVHSSPCSPQKG